ncbi:MAG: NAD(P)H-hydrate dehydratase [Bacteroidota bacterium]
MMKILNAEQTRLADAFTIENEPIPSIDLMERASNRFVEAFYPNFDPKEKLGVVCGTGNNGGDGLAVSRILLSKGYSVQPIVIQPKEGGSKDFQINLLRISELTEVVYIRNEEEIIDFSNFSTIIDAIFGSGLARPVTGFYAKVIEAINLSSAQVVAIDLPSGLFSDLPAPDGAIINADKTISFQAPKLSFFMPGNYQFVGDWHVVDIGLDKNYINTLDTKYTYIEEARIKSLLPSRKRFDHKGTFGHGQLIGGSYGKMGAMELAASAFIRTGAGLLTITVPAIGVNIMQTSVPEAMVLDQPGKKFIEDFNVLDKATIVGIGPGLDIKPETVKGLVDFLRKNDKHLVLDADALNILSENHELLEILPENTIITPHLKEFDRLAGNSDNQWQRIDKACELAERYNIIIVLKGAFTSIVRPDGTVQFNSTGNPGMATGGSGDVLLGIITALRTQGLTAEDAAAAGVYIHGMAGDIAAEDKSQTSLIATDIINGLSKVFLKFDR